MHLHGRAPHPPSAWPPRRVTLTDRRSEGSPRRASDRGMRPFPPCREYAMDAIDQQGLLPDHPALRAPSTSASALDPGWSRSAVGGAVMVHPLAEPAPARSGCCGDLLQPLEREFRLRRVRYKCRTRCTSGLGRPGRSRWRVSPSLRRVRHRPVQPASAPNTSAVRYSGCSLTSTATRSAPRRAAESISSRRPRER